MATRPSGTLINLDKVIPAERNHSGMDEGPPPQAINGPDMDLGVFDATQYADPAVVGIHEPGAPSPEKVSGITTAPRTSPEIRTLALVRLGQG